MIQIFGSDGNGESGPYSPTSISREDSGRQQFEFELN
jgi:hypothetical protein